MMGAARTGPFLLKDKVFLLGFSYTFCYLIIAHQLGAFSTDISTTPEGVRDRNAAIALPIITSYLWMANRYLIDRTNKCINKFVAYTHQTFDRKALTEKVELLSRLNIKLALALGTIIGFSYLIAEDLLTLELAPLKLWLNITAIPFWISSVMFILQLISITRFIIKQFLDNEKIDLFGIKKIIPISDLVITNTVVCAVSLALIPLFWIGNPIPMLDKIIVSSVFLVISFYLFWPVFKVQKQISVKKRLAILRINESIKRLFTMTEGTGRRLTDDPHRLRKLSSLISTKREISNATEWPIDLPQSIKGLLFTLSIPLSWIAGTLVETLISQIASL